MPDGEQTESAADDRAEGAAPEPSSGPIISAYGVASAALGVLSVAAIALGVIVWAAHRSDVDERRYHSRVLQAAVDWTGVLINMNTDNVTPSLQRLRDGTVGELNGDFDAAMRPYQQVVQRLQSRSRGQIEAVAMEAAHHEAGTQPGDDAGRAGLGRSRAIEPPPAARRAAPAEELPASVATRTDTVMVIATSVSDNAGGKPQTVHWNLRLGVSDVDGKLLISRLESIR
jgi:hypothetical protein